MQSALQHGARYEIKYVHYASLFLFSFQLGAKCWCFAEESVGRSGVGNLLSAPTPAARDGNLPHGSFPSAHGHRRSRLHNLGALRMSCSQQDTCTSHLSEGFRIFIAY